MTAKYTTCACMQILNLINEIVSIVQQNSDLHYKMLIYFGLPRAGLFLFWISQTKTVSLIGAQTCGITQPAEVHSAAVSACNIQNNCLPMDHHVRKSFEFQYNNPPLPTPRKYMCRTMDPCSQSVIIMWVYLWPRSPIKTMWIPCTKG